MGSDFKVGLAMSPVTMFSDHCEEVAAIALTQRQQIQSRAMQGSQKASIRSLSSHFNVMSAPLRRL